MIKKSPSPFAVNLETKCLKNGLRLTDQRRIIVKLLEETVSDTKFHPDVDQIHQMAIKIDKKIHKRVTQVDEKISIATVYRTVKLFEEAGILVKHDFKAGKSRYEAVTETHHDHLIDVNTGEITEFVDDEIEKLKKKLASKLGYDLIDHRLELYCKKKKVD